MTSGGADDWAAELPADSLLGRLPPAAAARLSSAWRVRDQPAGHMLLGADEPGDDVHFLLSGAARAAVFTETGREVAFADIGPGDCFGELAAFDGLPRSASVIAVEPVKAARIGSGALHRAAAEDYDLARALMRMLAGKLRATSQRLTGLAAMTAGQRLRSELLRIGRSRRVALDAAEILAPPTHGALARFIFTNRETVAREMARLRGEGLISTRAGVLRIESLSRLEASLRYGP